MCVCMGGGGMAPSSSSQEQKKEVCSSSKRVQEIIDAHFGKFISTMKKTEPILQTQHATNAFGYVR